MEIRSYAAKRAAIVGSAVSTSLPVYLCVPHEVLIPLPSLPNAINESLKLKCFKKCIDLLNYGGIPLAAEWLIRSLFFTMPARQSLLRFEDAEEIGATSRIRTRKGYQRQTRVHPIGVEIQSIQLLF